MADEYLSSKLTAPIDQLSLSGRTSDILKQNGVQTVTDLLSLQRDDLLKIAGFTDDAMAEVRALAWTYLFPLFQQYTRAEVGKAIQEVKQVESPPAQVIPASDNNQIKISPDDSLHSLPLPIRARNALMRGGIKTVADLLNASEFEIKNTRNVGAQLVEEIKAVKEKIQFAPKQSSQSNNNLLSSDTACGVLSRVTFYFKGDASGLMKLSPVIIKSLNNTGVHTDKDLLQSRLHQCAMMQDIALEDWEIILKEFKHLYREAIQQIQRVPIQEAPPYEIDRLELSKRTANRLLYRGVTDLQQIIQLTFADILSLNEFGPLALGELLTVLQGKSDEINEVLLTKKNSSLGKIVSLPDQIVYKLAVIGINDLTALERCTVEDLVVSAQLKYHEVQQVSEFLSGINTALLVSWPKDSLIRLSEYQFLKQAGIPLDKIKVSRLALLNDLEERLKSLKIETINDVALQSKAVLKTFLGHRGEEYTDILARHLKTYFTWLPNQSGWDDEIADHRVSPLYFILLKETTLEKVVDNLLKRIPHERNRKVIRLRFGLDGGGQRTLEQVGEQLSLTRERIRQIEKKSIDRLKKGTTDGLVRALYTSIADEMEAHGGFMSIAQIREPITDLIEVGEIDPDSTILLLLSLKLDQFVEIQKKRWGLKDISLHLVKPITEQLIRILRAASVSLNQEDLIKRLIQSELCPEDEIQHLVSSGFIEACLSTDDRFEKTGDDEWGLTKWHKRRTDEIIKALRKLGKPSHFTEIAEVANSMLPPSQRVLAKAYHAQISNKPHLFAWVGSGTFGLVEWGLKRVRFYVDIAEELLQKHGEPLSFEEIFPVINAERAASPESIKFMLGTNYRFRQYPDNKYGLASWVEESEDEDDSDDDFLDDLKRKLFDELFDKSDN